MKIGLRDTFRTADFLDPNEPSLVRMGALYYQGQRADQPKVQRKLRRLLEDYPSQDRQDTLLRMHAAILLAQGGQFDGIDYLVGLLTDGAFRERLILAETALRNCSQFPLANLIMQSIDLKSVNGQEKHLRQVMKVSEDTLSAYGRRRNQTACYDDLFNQLEPLLHLPRREGRDLAIGSIIRKPVRKDFGFRYTGFVGIERRDETPLVVPYDLGDVLNRNDQFARQDVWQLLREPGRRAIVVYDTSPPYEAQQLYILPFAPRTEQEMRALISEMALGAEGLQVGVVVELAADRYKGYRMLTSEGYSGLEHYQPDRQRIGSCFLIHDLNSQPLSTRFTVPSKSIVQVAERFKKNAPIDCAVHVRSYQDRHTLVSQQGRILLRYGDVSEETVYFVDEATVGGETRYFPFEVSGLAWEREERCQILNSFFSRRPETWGVVLETYEYKSKRYARIIHPQTGESFRPRVEQDYPAGTLAFFESGDDGQFYANVASGYRIQGGCPHCFGTSHRICGTCGGKGRIQCSDCDGTQRVACPDCFGSGREDCGHCSGTGQRELTCGLCDGTGVWKGECRNCKGSGIYKGSCTVCGGTGRYADTGRLCVKCGGSGDFTAECRRCSGRGYVTGTCKRCGGQGQSIVTCKTCNGTGRWDCGTCHGRGQVRCTCDYGTVICPTCEGGRVSGCECHGQKPGIIVAR